MSTPRFSRSVDIEANGQCGTDGECWEPDYDKLDSGEWDWCNRQATENKSLSVDPIGSNSDPIIITGLRLTRLSHVKRERVEWLWQDRFALGKISLVIGNPGENKSSLLLDVAATVSMGRPFYGERSGSVHNSGSVLILSSEDGVEDTIATRFDVAGGDDSKIIVVKREKGTFHLRDDIDKIRQLIDSVPDCRAFLIDPVTAYLGQTDSHKDPRVRDVLTPLAELAAAKNIAVIGVMHLNKSDCQALYRCQGSVGFVAQARAVWLVAKYQSENKRLLVCLKNNLAPPARSLAFNVESVERYIDGKSVSLPKIVWKDEDVIVTPDEVLGTEVRPRGPKPVKSMTAKILLQKQLANGPVSAEELYETAERNDVSERTLRRAADELGISKVRDGFGGKVLWSLPTGGDV